MTPDDPAPEPPWGVVFGAAALALAAVLWPALFAASLTR